MQEPTRHTSTPDAGAGGVASTHLSQPPPQEQQQDAAPSIVDILLPDTLISILKLLADSPSSIVAFGLTCSTAHALVVTHSTTTLWTDLCKSVVSSHQQQGHNNNNGACSSSAAAKTDPVWSPAAWGLRSHLELYIALLQPYCPLLRQRTWHTTKMLAGQLIVIDAEPARRRLVGRSVFFRTLQGPAFSHPVFAVELPRVGKGKASVFSFTYPPAGVESSSADAACTAATLQFLSTPAAVSAAAALSGAADSPIWDATAHNFSTHGYNAGAAAAAQGEAAGFLLLQRGAPGYGNLYLEQSNRWEHGQPYSYSPISPAASGGLQQQQQQPVAGSSAEPDTNAAAAEAAAASSADGTHSGSGGSSSSSGRQIAERLPLPEVDEYIMSRWEMRDNMLDAELPLRWRSHAVYSCFSPSAWLHPSQAPAAGGAGAAAGASLSLQASQTVGGGSSGSTSMPAPIQQDGSAPAATTAEGLAGLWRGTYGGHGVELVQLQLLQCPPGYDMWQQHQVPAAPAVGLEDCLPGVLLQSLLQLPPPVVHPDCLPEYELVSDTTEGSSEDGSDEDSDGDAAAAGGAAGGGDGGGVDAGSDSSTESSSSGSSSVGDSSGDVSTDEPEQQQQQQQPELEPEQQPEQQPQQRQLLLVASKVTGDRNVPAGQVTFAVDVGGSSGSSGTSGSTWASSVAVVGQPLQLPRWMHSAVEVNGPGTRPLIVKERLPGLAQIAETYFKAPRILPVELLVFEDEPGCFGLIWSSPMDNFSFFVKQPSLL